MVTVHRKPTFVLVTAHSQLGEAYLNARIFEQALDHLTKALKLNSDLLGDGQAAKAYHTHLLTMLGRTYLEAGNLKDSHALLDKSIAMCTQLNGPRSVQSAPILCLLAKVWTK